MTGTGMARPPVAGLAALRWQARRAGVTALDRAGGLRQITAACGPGALDGVDPAAGGHGLATAP